ncbi:MAG TPA: DUF6600 domain-containing protein [Methylomirabilota bacterium]|nr:DUF6600 domain-containing protein [Methylomirabilota bacterium]
MTTLRRSIATLLALTLLVGSAPLTWAADTPAGPPPPPAGAPPAADDDGQPAPDQPEGAAPTPPRLSYADGDVSFWRPGGDDWAPAQVNTPLAPGDQLYTGNRGNLEIQIEARNFVRAWGDSQLGLENHEPDFLQLKVAAGHVSLDLRALDGGRTVEVDTPGAAFTIERAGYYRVDVAPDRTSFVTRRGGVATMTPAGGQAVSIATSEQVVVTGSGPAPVQTFVAPELDVWDRWNYARTEALIDTVSARYVPAGVSGVDDLDQHGAWRVVPEYGSVWVPEGVAADWAPYTTGRWVWDLRFGWSWVDIAPWGWAPYHYGRWVHLDRVWAWAPGPVIVRPVYAPALVAFFGAPGVRVAIGAPFVSWVALGWGEPCVPWWGRPGFVGHAWWGGWGGPRIVNNVVVNRTTVVNVRNITVYRNVSVQNAVVAVRPDRFGRGPVGEARIRQVDTHRLEPVHGRVDLQPDRASFAAASGRGIRPPESVLARPTTATRAPVTRALPQAAEGRGPAPRIVPAPRAGEAGAAGARPPFGESRLERARPPQAPRFDTSRRPDGTPPAPPAARRSDGPKAEPRAPEPARGPQAPTPPDAARAPQGQAPRAPEARRGPEPSRAPAAPAPGRAPEPTRSRETPGPSARPGAVERPAAAPPRAAPPPQAQPRKLPGEPANRLYPGRAEQRPAPRAPEPRAKPAPPQGGDGHERGPAREGR